MWYNIITSVARPRASTNVDEMDALRKEIEGLKLKNQELKEQLEKQNKESSRHSGKCSLTQLHTLLSETQYNASL